MMVPLLLTACKVNNSAKVQQQAEENRLLKGFERIEISGGLEVRYTQADSFSVVVKAPNEVAENVVTRVDSNKLVVTLKDGSVLRLGGDDNDDVTVFVSSPDLLGVELKGSGDFECNRLLDTDNLDIRLQGSGDIEFADIVCDRINVSLLGSGDIEVKNVKTLQSAIELNGSGDIQMRFTDSGDITSLLTGSGDITLEGNVKNHRSEVRGSGDLNTRRLTVRK
jgi:hypothetical protein